MINHILEGMVALLLVISVAIAFLEVVMRYVFNSSLTWSFEFLLVVLTYMSFIGAYLALRTKAHLRILVVYFKLPRFGQIIMFVVNQVGVGLTVAVMAWWGWDYAFRFPHKTTLILGWPVSWLYFVIPAAGALMAVQVLWDSYGGLRRALAGLPIEDVSPIEAAESEL